MLQVAVNGSEIRVVEVPEPVVPRGSVLVPTSHSLISTGTESAGVGSGGRRENLVFKPIASVGSPVYTGAGGSGLGKERLEVFAGGASFVLDDVRRREVYGLREDELQPTWCAEMARGSGGPAL